MFPSIYILKVCGAESVRAFFPGLQRTYAFKWRWVKLKVWRAIVRQSHSDSVHSVWLSLPITIDRLSSAGRKRSSFPSARTFPENLHAGITPGLPSEPVLDKEDQRETLFASLHLWAQAEGECVCGAPTCSCEMCVSSPPFHVGSGLWLAWDGSVRTV